MDSNCTSLSVVNMLHLTFYQRVMNGTSASVIEVVECDKETTHFIAGFSFEVRLVFVFLLALSLLCGSLSALLVFRTVFKVEIFIALAKQK